MLQVNLKSLPTRGAVGFPWKRVFIMKQWLWLVCVVAAGFSGMTAVEAATTQIRDEAGFFSAETKTRAEALIASMQNKYQKGVVVETFQSIPNERRQQYSEAQKNKFFSEWLRERMRGTDGVHILITRSPSHLQVGVNPQTMREGFSADSRDRVRTELVDNFKRRDYDTGLMRALDLINTAYSENSRTFDAAATQGGRDPRATDTSYNPPATGVQNPPVATAPARSSGMGWMKWALILGVGYFALRAIMSFLRSRSTPAAAGGPGAPGGYGGGPGYGGPGGGGYGAGGGGGGFMGSILGGLLGGTAASWMGNKVFGRDAEASSRQQDDNTMGGTGAAGGMGGSADHGSSGGDFESPADSGGGSFDSGGDSGGSSDSHSSGGDF